MTARTKLVREIIRQEVHAMLFSVAIPDIPWSHAAHPKRKCMMTGCRARFDPKRWYSRFCSRECGAAHSQGLQRNWRARSAQNRKGAR